MDGRKAAAVMIAMTLACLPAGKVVDKRSEDRGPNRAPKRTICVKPDEPQGEDTDNNGNVCGEPTTQEWEKCRVGDRYPDCKEN